jgi:hypothetical protein
MKIPTILVLIVFIFALSLGLAIYTVNNTLAQQKYTSLSPIDIQVTNITDHSAVITWQTQVPSVGKIVLAAKSSETPDDRGLTPRLTHFVTIKSLSPNTLYPYQVKNDDQLYQTSQSFKTGSSIPDQPSISNFPVLGTILDQKLQPIDEALVYLKTDGNQLLAAYSSTAGNFVMPLSDLRTSDLKQSVVVNSDTSASLTIKKDGLKSEIAFKLPLSNTYLPTIQLGQDIDLTNYTPPPARSPEDLSNQQIPTVNKFDLNNDGKINVVDLSIMLDYLKTKKYVPSADFNTDKKVDQKDIDVLKQQLK